MNNQNRYTGVFWFLKLDCQEIFDSRNYLNFILHQGLNILMNFFQWTYVHLRYLDCLCLLVSDLQPVDSCIILIYCFLFYYSVDLSLLHYVTLCFTNIFKNASWRTRYKWIILQVLQISFIVPLQLVYSKVLNFKNYSNKKQKKWC